MLLRIDIAEKAIGPKHLFAGLRFDVEVREKVAIIGRNGVGKTTLFTMLSGADDNFTGDVQRQRGLRMVSTRQEFHNLGDQTCLEYIRDNLPEYRELQDIITNYPETMGADVAKIHIYSEALERFGTLGYYTIEDAIINRLAAYQIGSEIAHAPFVSLSGGQKRFADLVRVELSDADLALVDEPTNHMDYVGKAAFIKWLNEATHAVAVITHDRDVLAAVDRIIEIKDKRAFSFPGNYDAYLRQNGVTTVSQISDYETAQRTLAKLRIQVIAARSKKLAAPPDGAKKFRIMEDRLQGQYDRLEAATKRPSFWVDQETVSQMPGKVAERYHRYKAKNISIRGTRSVDSVRDLLVVRNLSLGYERPLFSGVAFALSGGDKIELKGRNGAGKTSLITAILAAAHVNDTKTAIFDGKIIPHPKLKLGYYEQEIKDDYLRLTLEDAITQTYHDRQVPIAAQKVKQILSDYLFDPTIDGRIAVEKLSGGQKARLQIITMLCGDPNLLILDEPTNHLDLPSIEELEKALGRYQGAMLFVSHDSYFAEKFGADIIQIGADTVQ